MGKYIPNRSGKGKGRRSRSQPEPKSHDDRFAWPYVRQTLDQLKAEAGQAVSKLSGEELETELKRIAMKMAYDVNGVDVPIGFGETHWYVLHKGRRVVLKGSSWW